MIISPYTIEGRRERQPMTNVVVDDSKLAHYIIRSDYKALRRLGVRAYQARGVVVRMLVAGQHATIEVLK